VITDGAISEHLGMIISAVFVVLFTALAGMMAVAYTDLPNGIIIVVAVLISLPFVYLKVGGWHAARATLPPDFFQVFNSRFGAHPVLKGLGYALSTFMLLMGVQSMYQKFYSAKTPKDAKVSVVFWVIGTVIVETAVVAIAVFSMVKLGHMINPNVEKEGGKLVLLAARYLVPAPVGVLLLAAAVVVVISTGMNYLLSPTTNIMRDVYQRMINPNAKQSTMVFMQRLWVVILGGIAFALAWKLQSVLQMAYFAYVIYGVAITPALIAALAWKRATRAGGITSIVSGTVVTIGLKIMTYVLPERMMPGGDPFGIPIIYPALIISVGTLIVVSLLTTPPSREELEKLFPEKEPAA